MGVLHRGSTGKEYVRKHGIGAGQAVFPISKCRMAEILKLDLEAAGIPYKDRSGLVFDFHGLRSQLGTSLARAGVDQTTAQKLLHHSDPRLTSNQYTHLATADLRVAIAKLPPPPAIKIT